jgi:urocanate hydratase
MVTDQTSAHDLVYGYLPRGWSVERWKRPRTILRSMRRSRPQRRRRSSRTSRRCSPFHRQGVPTFDYGNNIRQVAQDEGVADAFASPASCRRTSGRSFAKAKGPVRWVASVGRSGGHLQDRSEVLDLFPDNAHLKRWLGMARSDCVPGLAGAHLLAGPG